jgi:thiol-disulfide isomerase/thioredoxin
MKKLILIIILLSCTRLFAQQAIRPLKIGDTIPAIVLTNLLNQNGPISLSTLHKQPLLIINFWATWCVPCLRELPRLDSLAAAHPAEMKVLSVAYEQRSVVSAFLAKHPEIKTGHLVMTTDDHVLINYFKHNELPHNVWIDQNGVVKNITSGDEINDQNVLTFIHHMPLHVHNLTAAPDFDVFGPFHLSDSVFEYRSILTKYIDGIPGGHSAQGVFHHPTERWLIRDFSFNSSRQHLLWTAVDKDEYTQDYYGIMKIITSDSTRFFWPNQCPLSFARSKYTSRLDWEFDNLYCYELTLPFARKDSAFYDDELNDLKRIFNIEVTVEHPVIPTCNLTLKSGYKFKRPLNDSAYIDLGKNKITAHNVSILRLFNLLNKKIKPERNSKCDDPPYIDKTGIKHNIDLEIEFSGELPTYTEIKKLIKNKYGIGFQIVKQPYPVTIIKDLTP